MRPPLIEFRQYVIAPGKRDRMIELFDAYFVEAQDAVGLPILGHFRVEGDPDRLVWLRGFPDMPTRPTLLGAFYGGPVWTTHGAEAIACVAGYDNVQLLREASPGSGIDVDPATRPATANAEPGRPVLATTYRLAQPAGDDFLELCTGKLSRDRILGLYVTDPAPNNFPPLPVREGEHLVTWFCMAEDAVAPDETELEPFFAGPPEKLVLLPCNRSLLR